MYISYLISFSVFPDLFQIFSGKYHRRIKLIVSETALLILFFASTPLVSYLSCIHQFLLPETRESFLTPPIPSPPPPAQVFH